jgi:hypothetical protein
MLRKEVRTLRTTEFLPHTVLPMCWGTVQGKPSEGCEVVPPMRTGYDPGLEQVFAFRLPAVPVRSR